MDTVTTAFTVITYLICIYVGVQWLKDWMEAKPQPVQTRSRRKPGAARPVEAVVEPVSWYENKWIFIAVFCTIAIVGILARSYRFWEIPFGLNQDEASIGYDSFAIGHFGFDRNGFRFPVYPIGFGNGHGPLYTYLSIPAIRIFGLSIFSVRLTNVVLSCVAVITSYFLVKRLTGSRLVGLIGFGLMATAPTLIISARWALDGCPPPSLMIIGMYLFVRAVDSQKTVSYALTAAFFALVCYSYGPAAIVVLVFLPMACIYLLVNKKITWLQLAISAAAFAVVIAPIAIFMAREMIFDTPASDPNGFMTFPRFTGRRTDTVMVGGINPANFVAGLRFVIFQPWCFIYNVVPGFGTTYLFTAPLIIFGLIVLFIKLVAVLGGKQYSHMFLIFAYFFASFIMMGTLDQNVNRVSAAYPAVVLLITLGVWEIYKCKRYGQYMLVALCAFIFVSFGGFITTYFSDNYRRDFGRMFFYSFGDAITFAMEKTDDTIYVTMHNQNMPGIKTLFYSQLPPERYFNTVVYINPDSEFRWEASFDRFIFGTPHHDQDPTAVFVIDHAEVGLFSPYLFARREFRYYSVMYPIEWHRP